MNKKRNLFIRIMCIFLAALMVLGIVVAGISAFAVDATEAAPLPDTGSGDIAIPIIIVALLVVAVVIVIVCAVTGKKKK
ncbi:MAG: hypothetical protein MJ121_02855 [Clostridia bacterium]|nr:hypothetical protein [Clostridia bacterium]